jgi:aspartokinase
LAVGLSASELQIWKEVDGIFTADPRKVPTARLIPIISPAEAAELTYYGSEVVHPFTMEQVCVFLVTTASGINAHNTRLSKKGSPSGSRMSKIQKAAEQSYILTPTSTVLLSNKK